MNDWLIKKYGLEKKGTPIEIPSVRRTDLAQWLHELNFKLGVEVGVAAGEYSKTLCDLNPQMTLYGIDPWIPYDGYTDYQKPTTFGRLYTEMLVRMKESKNFVPVQTFSMDAVKDFEDDSLDFVYIDANHTDPFVTQDITEWTKKVRKGGIVAGHDYIRLKEVKCDVIDAITRYTKENGIDPWFVLGTKPRVPGNVRDTERSWMFFK